jgi:hypothetical protein
MPLSIIEKHSAPRDMNLKLIYIKLATAVMLALGIALPVFVQSNVRASEKKALQIGEFTREQLIKQDVTCGIYLEKLNRTDTEYTWVFVQGDETAEMMINGRMIVLNPTTVDKLPANQRISESFLSQDKLVSVRLDLQIGNSTSHESVSVSGTLKARRNGQEVNLPVKGSSGC